MEALNRFAWHDTQDVLVSTLPQDVTLVVDHEGSKNRRRSVNNRGGDSLKRVKVAVVRPWFLPSSETFIYGELVHLKRTKAIVCAKKRMNRDQFPFSSIYKYKNYNQLPSLFRKKKVGLIHARFGTTGIKLLSVKKKTKLPMLTSFHGFDLPSNKNTRRKYGKKFKRLFKEGNLFTATSKNMRKILIKYGCPKKKIIVHHSGIDVHQFSFKPREKPKDKKIYILSVGRLVEKKGMKNLIEAFVKVNKKNSRVYLRIVGDGELRRKLKKKVRRLGLKNRVTFLGELSHEEVAKEMKKSHIFVLASLKDKNGNQEGIPNVIKEAMASGMPVVSTRHAGIPELVRDGESGYLVPEKNSKALSKALLKLIRRPQKWEKIGRAGRDIVEESFNVHKQIDKLEAIYDKLLGRKG